MTSSGDIKNPLDDTLKAYGKVDILVNNAGVMHQVLTMSLDMAKDYDAIMNVSLRAYFETIAVIGGHIGKGGSIINIAVIGGLGGAYPVATHVASKAAVIPLTKSCAKEAGLRSRLRLQDIGIIIRVPKRPRQQTIPNRSLAAKGVPEEGPRRRDPQTTFLKLFLVTRTTNYVSENVSRDEDYKLRF